MELALGFKLLLDESNLDKALVKRRLGAGHDAKVPNDFWLMGKTDEEIFRRAVAEDRIMLTANPVDFIRLGREYKSKGLQYPGWLLMYKDADKAKHMSNEQVVKAIRNLLSTGADLRNMSWSLKAYR
jgi:predicted nuclease of predicted toxin-antitoxin system